MIILKKTSATRTAVPGGAGLVLVVVLAVGCGSGEGTGGGATGQGEPMAETAATTQGKDSPEVADSVGGYVLPGEAVYPEGIAYKKESMNFLVSSTTDGTSFWGNAELDEDDAEVFLKPSQDGRDTAVGLKVDEEGRPFILGGTTDRIFVYDI